MAKKMTALITGSYGGLGACFVKLHAQAGGLSDTKMFANAVAPDDVAKDGYNAMLKGELNCTSGLISWQRPLMKLQPLFPKKMMMNFVYDQQSAGSAKK